MASRWTIQIKKGSTVKELILNREPLPTWPFGKLGDVGKLNVASTRMLEIDSTPESDRFFEMMKEVNVVTDLPRRKLDCHLLYDGAPIMENCKVVGLTYQNKKYKLVLATDNAELIDLLNNNISDLDWSAYEIGYTAAAQLATYDPTAPDHMLYITNYFKAEDDATLLDSEFNLPLVSLNTLYTEILSQNGLTSNVLAINDFENDLNFKKKYLQLATRDIAKDNKASCVMNVAYEVPDNWATGDPQIAEAPDTVNYSGQSGEFWTVGVKTFNYTDLNSPDLVNEPVLVLAYPLESVVITAKSRNTGLAVPSGCKIVIAHYKTEGATAVPYAIKVLDQNDTGIQKFTFTDTEVGDYFVLLGVRENDGAFTMQFDVNLYPANLEYYYDQPTSLFKLKDNLPDLKQIDIIKYIMNTFCLLADFDTIEKKVIFYDYGHLIEQYELGKYIDITSYVVDVEDIGIDHSGAMAQNNYLLFDNSSGVGATSGRGNYQITNENIEPERDAYKAPFSFSDTFSGFAVLPYPVQQEPTSNPNIFEFEDVGVRIVDVESGFAKLENVDFQQNIDDYYIDFQSSNEDFKLIDVSSKLPMPIVKKMISKSEKLPIFINYFSRGRQISGVFKLNSINSWTDKRAVKLELKKLI